MYPLDVLLKSFLHIFGLKHLGQILLTFLRSMVSTAVNRALRTTEPSDLPFVGVVDAPKEYRKFSCCRRIFQPTGPDRRFNLHLEHVTR